MVELDQVITLVQQRLDEPEYIRVRTVAQEGKQLEEALVLHQSEHSPHCFGIGHLPSQR
jgi:hypothetical protein